MTTQIRTPQIQDDAVTYAKIQNISATQRALGRNTAGAGDTEEVTLSQLLDWVGSAANGDILLRSGGSWTRLAKGTEGRLLRAGATLPAYGVPAGEIVASHYTANDESTTSTSFVDLTTAQSVTFTMPEAGDVFILGSATTYNSVGEAPVAIAADVDGTDQTLAEGYTNATAANRTSPIAGGYKVNLSAASHTIKLQFKSPNGTTTHYIWRSLVIWRLP